jgi:hypothetical protein
MAFLNIGPEGLLLVWAAIVSVVVALLSWRRASLSAAAIATLGVALALVAWQMFELEPSTPGHRFLSASFIVVPSALLLGASRLSWLARRSWMLLVAGPFAFVGCYVGICECVYRLVGSAG